MTELVHSVFDVNLELLKIVLQEFLALFEILELGPTKGARELERGLLGETVQLSVDSHSLFLRLIGKVCSQEFFGLQ